MFSHRKIIVEKSLVNFVMLGHKNEFLAIYELDNAKECSNRVFLYVHGKESRFERTWFWYFHNRLYYGACVWMSFGRCLHALRGF